MGLAQGDSIYAAQCYGGKRSGDLKRTVAQSYLISVGAVILLETASQLLLHPVIGFAQRSQQRQRKRMAAGKTVQGIGGSDGLPFQRKPGG